MAKAVSQHVWGKLFEERVGGNGRSALLLTQLKPEMESEQSLTLRLAFVVMGTEVPLFPSFLVDDWGGEVRGTAVYSWVRENGNQFPRAEIFGFDRQGNSVQFFVRELELYARLLCFAYPNAQTPLAEGKLVHAVLLPDASAAEVEKIKRPSEIKRPLASARVTWWQVPLDLPHFDFSLLDDAQASEFI
ncbi:MAG: hypothetical protein IT327_22425 [Anaerolineae bacterium]|nr:hypothetical protein [Anaerolineae bacterium]